MVTGAPGRAAAVPHPLLPPAGCGAGAPLGRVLRRFGFSRASTVSAGPGRATTAIRQAPGRTVLPGFPRGTRRPPMTGTAPAAGTRASAVYVGRSMQTTHDTARTDGRHRRCPSVRGGLRRSAAARHRPHAAALPLNERGPRHRRFPRSPGHAPERPPGARYRRVGHAAAPVSCPGPGPGRRAEPWRTPIPVPGLRTGRPCGPGGEGGGRTAPAWSADRRCSPRAAASAAEPARSP